MGGWERQTLKHHFLDNTTSLTMTSFVAQKTIRPKHDCETDSAMPTHMSQLPLTMPKSLINYFI